MSARATLSNAVVISKNLEWPPSSFKVHVHCISTLSYSEQNYLSSLYHFDRLAKRIFLPGDFQILPTSERLREIN